MLIKKISKINSYNSFQKTQHRNNILSQDKSQDFSLAFTSTSKLYTDFVSALKLEMDEFPQDVAYRKKLMLNAGKNPEEYYKLRSIIGVRELKTFIKQYSEDESVYSVGVNDENILNKKIRANLHIHTLASDGFMSTEELLEKARIYADEAAKIPEFKKEPFIIAITDHDAIDSTREAIEIISKNPYKYRNVRVVLGIENTTYNNILPDFVKSPTNTHILMYGIDPNDKEYQASIENRMKFKSEIKNRIVNKANETYKKVFEKKDGIFSVDEADEYYNPLKKNIIGIFNYAQKYLEAKFIVKEIVLKNAKWVKKLENAGIKGNAEDIFKAIKDFYYSIDKNNKPRGGKDIISAFLADKISIYPDEVKSYIKKTFRVEVFERYITTLNSDLEEYKTTLTPKYKYMPTIEDIFNSVEKNDDVIVGIAHPLEYIENLTDFDTQKIFLEDLFLKFKKAGGIKAVFSEVYYQSYDEKLRNLKESEEFKKLFDYLSNKFQMLKTGSADSHRTNVFKRLF